MFYLLTCSVILVLGFLLARKKRFAYWKERDVPYPTPSLLGNTGKVLTLEWSLWQICHDVYREFKGYSYVGIFNFWRPALVIRDPELVKEVLIKKFNHFQNNIVEQSSKVDFPWAYNPFLLQNDKWKTIRTQLTPQFTSLKVKTTLHVIEKVCEKMTRFIDKRIESGGSNCIEAKDLCARFTGDNVFSWGYGIDGKAFEVEVPDAIKIGEQISSPNKTVQLKQTLALFFPFVQRLLKITALGDPVPQMFWKMILDTIKFREENRIESNDYLNFIKEMKTTPCGVSNELLVAHAFTLFLDGYETSSLTLTFALFELARNKDVQSTASEEVKTVLLKHNGQITNESLQEMEYLENVISETLRKYPIITIIARTCTQDCTFPSPRGVGRGDDVLIKKGTQIFIPATAIQNDPAFYPDPEKFDPDRFLEEEKNARPKVTFMGFGEGPRTCLGKRFALAQTKMALVTILRNYEVKLNENIKLPIAMTKTHFFNAPLDDILLDFYRLR